jgi:cation:H+ antiporter
MSFISIFFMTFGGFIALILGGNWLVDGASLIAKKLGIPSLIIGLTIVAFGTSTPELAVSLSAALKGNADIAIANIVGSNIFNVLFILGASSIITPLLIHQQIIKRELPVLIVITLLFYFFSWDKSINRWEGAFLFTLSLLYTTWLVITTLHTKKKPFSKENFNKKHSINENIEIHLERESFEESETTQTQIIGSTTESTIGSNTGPMTNSTAGSGIESTIGSRTEDSTVTRTRTRTKLLSFFNSYGKPTFLFLLGLGFITKGADWLVEGASQIALIFEISEAVIGVTIVAIGTSLPEVAASIAASLKGQRDIAVGNVIGSNIYNILAIIGLSGFVVPNPISVSEELLHTHYPVMMGATLLCLPFFRKDAVLGRFVGLLFLFAYIGYTTLLIFQMK